MIIRAQHTLGADKTSAYYAFAPFIGTFLSLILFGQPPASLFWIALPIMLLGAYLAARE